jgi:hypothetical protein
VLPPAQCGGRRRNKHCSAAFEVSRLNAPSLATPQALWKASFSQFIAFCHDDYRCG